MNLPKLSQTWQPPELIKALIECLRQIEAADRQNRKTGADVEIGPARLIMTDTLTGERVAVTIAAGAIVITAL